MNQHAEYAVICSILKYPPCISAFDALQKPDFTQSTFWEWLARMRELAAAGQPINGATVNCNVSEEQMLQYAEDGLNQDDWAGIVSVIKECAYRARIVRALGLDFEKCEDLSTPKLVQMADEKAKESEPYKALVDEYVPSLKQKQIEWETLSTEDEILEQQGTSLEYVVDEIVPKRRVTMLFGQEKSGKSIIALDLCKHIVNGKTWLNRKVAKTPCLYLDLEDGIVGAYIGWLKGVGEEKIRFITIRSENGIPQLDDPGLLGMCTEVQPVIVLDSLHKLFSRNKEGKFGSAWQSSDYEPVLEKIRQLCVAGATVILIHHATKSDKDQYRDSSAIGANVDFMFAVEGDEPENGIKRLHLKGKPSRGAQPPTLHILAFPHIIQHGHLCLDAGLEEADQAARRATEEVRNNGP
ncbi:MAG: AAA family ATPase, partial [Candidatus Acidiferrales bacterium]